MSRFVACVLAPFLLLTGCTPAPSSDDEVAAWEAFCDRLKATGVEILRDHPQSHEIDRQEALRYLAQQVAYVIRNDVIAEDPSLPLLRVGATTIDKWGLDGADAKYLGARIRGDGVYRLHGRLGNARLVAMQSFRMNPDYEAYASMSGDDWGATGGGAIDVRIAAARPDGWAGPWLPIDPNATNLLVREYFEDWANEHPSTLYLERLDAPDGAPTPRHEGRLERMADAFEQRAPMWLTRSERIRTWVTNEFASRPQKTDQGLKDNAYGMGWFEIGSDEALLIELDAPDALLWSFQLGNFWWESLDYVHRTASLNGHQAVPSSDGRYRLVVALEDPGVPNWLDPGGHPEGLILYRFQGAEHPPEPEARLVALNELRAHLPADTPGVTPEQRQAEIAMRRRHVTRRWAP